jgi:hypothetical protein
VVGPQRRRSTLRLSNATLFLEGPMSELRQQMLADLRIRNPILG